MSIALRWHRHQERIQARPSMPARLFLALFSRLSSRDAAWQSASVTALWPVRRSRRQSLSESLLRPLMKCKSVVIANQKQPVINRPLNCSAFHFFVDSQSSSVFPRNNLTFVSLRHPTFSAFQFCTTSFACLLKLCSASNFAHGRFAVCFPPIQAT